MSIFTLGAFQWCLRDFNVCKRSAQKNSGYVTDYPETFMPTNTKNHVTSLEAEWSGPVLLRTSKQTRNFVTQNRWFWAVLFLGMPSSHRFIQSRSVLGKLSLLAWNQQVLLMPKLQQTSGLLSKHGF